MVRKHGRITELILVMKLFLKTDWLAALGNWRLGLDLMKTGRFSLVTERIRHRGDVDRMMAAIDGKDGGKS
jgi:hypothetical protein